MIEESLGIKVELRPGAPGQFDVEADGERLELPRKTFWQRLLTGPWPDEQAVVTHLEQRRAGAG